MILWISILLLLVSLPALGFYVGLFVGQTNPTWGHRKNDGSAS